MKAGFAKREITPPAGTRKIGWLQEIVGRRVLDPLYARALVVEDAMEARIALVSLDVLSVPWKFVSAIRAAVRSVPGDRVMVCATHSHAGPAVARAGVVPRDEPYAARAVALAAAAIDEAVAALAPADLFVGATEERTVSFNRRVVMRDGTVRTHGSLQDPQADRLEGPIDSRVAVLAFRSPQGAPLGVVVHHALHPTDHGGDECFSAGWPGALCGALEAGGWPQAVFLQGAFGNIATGDPAGTAKHSMEQVGAVLAAAAERAAGEATRDGMDRVGSRAVEVRLPYRVATEAEIRGTVRGAQRFIDPAIYDAGMPRLLRKIAVNGAAPATLQALHIGGATLVSLPCEPFVELGLAIQAGGPDRLVLPVGAANGMLGYVPTREAFARGGYETTFIASSKLAPEAGEQLVAAATELVGTR